LIILIILDEKYLLWSYSLSRLLEPPVIICPRSKYPPQHPVLKHPSLCSSMSDTKFHTHTELQAKLIFVLYSNIYLSSQQIRQKILD
jgi:hypothetical protein